MNPMAPFDLTGFGVTSCDFECSLHRFDTWGMRTRPTVHNESAHGPSGENGCGSRNCFGVGGINVGREKIEKLILVSQHVGLPIKKQRHISMRDVIEKRQQFVAHPIPDEDGVGVGRVVHHWCVERVAQRNCVRPS